VISSPGRHCDAASGFMFYQRFSSFSKKLLPLSIDSWCKDINADCCVNTINEKIPIANNLVNFG